MTTLRTAQRIYDRRLPEDLRTDAQIEEDAAERARERRNEARLSAYVFDPVRWAKVAAARIQEASGQGTCRRCDDEVPGLSTVGRQPNSGE